LSRPLKLQICTLLPVEFVLNLAGVNFTPSLGLLSLSYFLVIVVFLFSRVL